MMTKLPALFIGHGSPMNTLELNDFTRTWRRLGEVLPRPRALLVISAHWSRPGRRTRWPTRQLRIAEDPSPVGQAGTYDAGNGQRVAAATGLTEVLWPTQITTAKVVILGLAGR